MRVLPRGAVNEAIRIQRSPCPWTRGGGEQGKPKRGTRSTRVCSTATGSQDTRLNKVVLV